MERDDLDGPGIGGPLLAFDQLVQIEEIYLGGSSITDTIPSNFLASAKERGEEIYVELVDNVISGTVPASLAQFDELRITLKGNKISGIADALCSISGWMGGEVEQYGYNIILCPMDSYSEIERQSNSDTACK